MTSALARDRTTNRPLRRRGFAAAALLQLAANSAALAADEPDLTWLDHAALATGAVLLNTDRGDRPLTVYIKVAIEVHAPAEAIWEVLRACQIAPEYVPNVVDCRSLEIIDEGAAELFIQTVKPIFFVPSFEHVFRLDYHPYRRMEVHRVSGPIEHMEGSWWLLPQPGGSILLLYELALDPGLPIPRFFVRATLKRDLPKVLEAVRERAEAGR
jgi:hypothetical protein